MKNYLQLLSLVFLGLISMEIFAQEEYIHGKVTDKDGKPLQSVLVKARYQGNFTKTDSNGNYRLYLKAKQISIVEFIKVGVETQIEEFYLRKGDKREINIAFWDMDIRHTGTIICTFPERKGTLRRKPPPKIPMIAEIILLEDNKLLIERQ